MYAKFGYLYIAHEMLDLMPKRSVRKDYDVYMHELMLMNICVVLA